MHRRRSCAWRCAAVMFSFCLLVWLYLTATVSKPSVRTISSSSRNKKTLHFTPPKVTIHIKRPRCVLGKIPPHLDQLVKPSSPSVTVVTAYFNLGKFVKSGRVKFETATYLKWAGSYGYLQNPTVFYTDSSEIAQNFAEIRGVLKNVTKIIKLERKSIWSFKLADKISAIFSLPGFPKYIPNTVNVNYSCTQHAKYDFLEDAVSVNYFQTKYVTWLDLGYFRLIADRKRKFLIVPPRDFNESRIAMNMVNTVNMSEKADVIIKYNHVWVGGGMVFGIPRVMKLFIQDYKRAVERYLEMKVINTDQQVIFAMNTVREKNLLKPKVELQVYMADVEMDCWFYLGYSCYREIR